MIMKPGKSKEWRAAVALGIGRSASILLLLAAFPVVAAEVYRARNGQVLACENAEAVVSIATLQRQQPVDQARIRMVSARGRCLMVPADVTLAVEARQDSPAGTVALVRSTTPAGEYMGGRWWVMSDGVEISGFTR